MAVSVYGLITTFALAAAGLFWFYFRIAPKPQRRWLDNVILVIIVIFSGWFAYVMVFDRPQTPDVCYDQQGRC